MWNRLDLLAWVSLDFRMFLNHMPVDVFDGDWIMSTNLDTLFYVV